jgi:hypothetical protein
LSKARTTGAPPNQLPPSRISGMTWTSRELVVEVERLAGRGARVEVVVDRGLVLRLLFSQSVFEVRLPRCAYQAPSAAMKGWIDSSGASNDRMLRKVSSS